MNEQMVQLKELEDYIESAKNEIDAGSILSAKTCAENIDSEFAEDIRDQLNTLYSEADDIIEKLDSLAGEVANEMGELQDKIDNGEEDNDE